MLERRDNTVRGHRLNSAQMTDREVLIMWRVLIPPPLLQWTISQQVGSHCWPCGKSGKVVFEIIKDIVGTHWGHILFITFSHRGWPWELSSHIHAYKVGLHQLFLLGDSVAITQVDTHALMLLKSLYFVLATFLMAKSGQKQLKSERNYCGSQVRGVRVHRGKEAMAESKVSCCLVPAWNTVLTRKQRVWARRKVVYDLQGLFPSELLPLARPQFLKVQDSPKIEPPAGNQVWKHMDLWETFHTQTVILLLWFRYVCKGRVFEACSVVYGAWLRRHNVTSGSVT